MYKLRATISKDVRLLLRDKIGLIFMFGMPILLVLIVTTIQNSTFELVNKNKVSLLVCNRDTGAVSRSFVAAIDSIGFFQLVSISGTVPEDSISERIRHKDALLGLVIPADFSARIAAKARNVTGKVQDSFWLEVT